MVAGSSNSEYSAAKKKPKIDTCYGIAICKEFQKLYIDKIKVNGLVAHCIQI